MPAPLSNDMRTRIIHAVEELKLSYRKAAAQLQLSPATVMRIHKQWKDSGSTAPKQMGGSRAPAPMQQEHLCFLEAQLDQCSTSVTLETLQVCMHAQFGTLYSISSIWRIITQRLQYRLKHTHLMPQDYNSETRIAVRQAWCVRFLQEGFSLMDCIYVDESGFNLHQIRTLKYACKGQRTIQVRPSQKGKNTTLVLGTSKEGIIAYDFKQGAYTGASFTAFIADALLPAMQQMRMHNRVIIMDNCRIHLNAGVRAAIAAAGHQLHFLPPYSPFLNAAEWVFAHVKLQLHKSRLASWEHLTQHMQEELDRITADRTSGWICEVCRNFTDAMQSLPLGLTYHADAAVST